MKKRVEDEVSPITVTKITDHQVKNSFVSNASDMKRFAAKDDSKLQILKKDQSQINFIDDKSAIFDDRSSE